MEQPCCNATEISELRADLEFANGRILGYQEHIDSLTNAKRTADARNDELERENAMLRKMLGQSDQAMRITMVQNLARRAA